MANTQHMIELNGRLYDAASGKPVNAKQPKPVARNIDGFSQPRPITVQHQASETAARRHKLPKAAQGAKSAHKPAQKSKTLMRSAVKKPVNQASPASATIQKPGGVPSVRLSRAEKISKSGLISRFGSKSSGLQAQIAPLPVQSAPSGAGHKDKRDSAVSVPAAQARVAAQGALSKTIDMDEAVHKASSHQQPRVPKKPLSHRVAKRLHLSPKAAKMASITASVLLLGGFFVYNNLPRIAMRLAAARAGVSASLPDYQPAGFGLSKDISYSPGEVTVQYQSNSDERSFALTQKATDLDSQSLLEKEVAVNNQPYQTLENQGKTIYILKGTNATWVDDGKLYQIEGNSALSSEQLLRVANSL